MHGDSQRVLTAFLKAHPECADDVRYVQTTAGEEPEPYLSLPAMRVFVQWARQLQYIVATPAQLADLFAECDTWTDA